LRLAVLSCLLVAISGFAINGNPRASINRHMLTRPIFPSGKIVGGSNVAITDVPWQVALEDGGFLFCGGSIISANYVLTAAHCTDGNTASRISIRYGTDTLQSGGSTVKVSKIAQNPQFSMSTLDYDVSVLTLASPVSLSSSAKAVTLSSAEAASGQTASVFGWGATQEGGGLPRNLQRGNVPVVARATCNSAYSGDITARMICAGEAGKDSCQGDSGGPIVIGTKQVGIVSWGYGCARAGYPGVYSNVAALKTYIDNNSNNEATWG